MALSSDQITANNFNDFYGLIKPYLNGGAHAACTPIGTIIAVMGNSAPKNYLVCDGQVVTIASYPELANYFEEQFGTKNYFGGDGTTTFAVPDLRGEFLRGTGTNSHADCGDGANVGTHQKGTQIPHFRIYTDNDNYMYIQGITPYPNKGVFNDYAAADKTIITVLPDEHAWTNLKDTDSPNNHTNEWIGAHHYVVRPTNTSVLYCIAAKNIYVDPQFNYSTDEQVVGTWIDGKPLYQKTIETQSPSELNTMVNICSAPTNMDKLISLDGYLYLSNSVFPVNVYVNSTNMIACWIRDQKQSVGMRIGSDAFISVPVIVTLLYTKTTDV